MAYRSWIVDMGDCALCALDAFGDGRLLYLDRQRDAPHAPGAVCFVEPNRRGLVGIGSLVAPQWRVTPYDKARSRSSNWGPFSRNTGQTP